MNNKNLTKSKERILGGICGGVAAYAGCSAVWVRLIWILLSLAGGFGVVAYIVLWMVLPQPKRKSFQERMEERLHGHREFRQE